MVVAPPPFHHSLPKFLMSAPIARILYMEPQRALAEQVDSQLRRVGYDISVQPLTLNQHLTPLQSHDILIVRHDAPPAVGGPLLPHLRQAGVLPNTILLIPPGQEALAIEAMRLGAGDYVMQDDNNGYLELLPIVVERLLSRQRLARDKFQALAVLQGRNRVLSLLNHISHEVTSIHDPDEVVERILTATIEIMGAQGCSLWLWGDEARTYLVCQAVTDQVVSPPLKGVRVEAGQGVVGWVASHNQSAVVQQTTDDVRFLSEVDVQINFQTQSLMAVPMRMRDEVLGVLEVVNKLEGPFNQDDQNVAKTLAASAATAIENARLVRALRRYTAELEERNAELDAFAHTVAHDIQNMLARIMGFAELLRMDLHDETIPLDRQRLLEPAEFVANNSRRMSKVVEALLLLSAVRQQEVTASSLNMGIIVGEVLDRLSLPLAESGGHIAMPEAWPTAVGYAPWVEEVWYNYLTNALKYGGEPPHITLGAETAADGQVVRFWVQDNGPGISPADQKLLFQPFSQIGKRRRGHGLGLSIVERIATKMGGTVGVESGVGQGSRFWFTLPVAVVSG
jgi:signal transduction histidine kinase